MSYKDLRVWQDAMELVVAVYKISEQLPKCEIHGIVSQVRRSAVSIPSNIAEGWGRKREKEFYRFLDIAYGSSCELETQLEVVSRCYSIEVNELKMQCQAIQKQVGALQKKMGVNGGLKDHPPTANNQ